MNNYYLNRKLKIKIQNDSIARGAIEKRSWKLIALQMLSNPNLGATNICLQQPALQKILLKMTQTVLDLRS
jgi:hypothetical protein